MGSRFFNTVVVLFWITTMTWLVVAKVWPTLRVGDPPNYRSILEKEKPQSPVCWQIRWDDEPIGWAATRVSHRQDGMTELHSRVFFAQLPLHEMAPNWLGPVVRPMLRQIGQSMDAKSRLVIDPLGRLVGFESRVRLTGKRDLIRMQGDVDGAQLKLVVQSGDFSYRTERYLPPDALVADELSPQSQLPGLRLGQTWTTPVYSPFLPPSSPVEILDASVERQDSVVWNGKEVETLLVVYRADSGSGLLSRRETRGKLWVLPDGTVVKQERKIFNSRLHFVRLPEKQGELLAAALGDEWWMLELETEEAKELLSQISSPESP